MQRFSLSIVLIFTLLASIGGINKAVLMSYNLLTDSDKAARLCTCTSCSVHSNDSSDELMSCCSSSTASDSKSESKSDQKSNSYLSCGIPTANGSYVCGCDDNKLPEEQNKLLVLDKVTMPEDFIIIPPVPHLQTLVNFQESHTSLFHPGIFHPPRT